MDDLSNWVNAGGVDLQNEQNPIGSQIELLRYTIKRIAILNRIALWPGGCERFRFGSCGRDGRRIRWNRCVGWSKRQGWRWGFGGEYRGERLTWACEPDDQKDQTRQNKQPRRAVYKRNVGSLTTLAVVRNDIAGRWFIFHCIILYALMRNSALNNFT